MNNRFNTTHSKERVVFLYSFLGGKYDENNYRSGLY